MKESEITALAREYAEEIWPTTLDKKAGYKTLEALRRLREIEFKKAERVIRSLLRRYCLVEKNGLKDVRQHIMNKIKAGKNLRCKKTIDEGKAQRTILDALFPEIGKEEES